MKVNAGLWIDQRRALIVSTFDGGHKTLEIRSHVDSQPSRTDGVKSPGSFEAQLVQADDSRQRAYAGHLNAYYAEIIGAVRDAESIFIFGPGEAKEELRKHLQRARLGDKIVGIETCDKMTDPQIAAKVEEQFHKVPLEA